MKAMTYDQYDRLSEQFEDITVETMWPTVEQIDMFGQDPDKWIEFACYLHDKGEKPKTKEESYGKKNLMDFINENLYLTEGMVMQVIFRNKEKIKKFAEIAGSSGLDIKIINGGGFVDGCKAEDILNMDTSHPRTMVIEGDEEIQKQFLEDISPFVYVVD